MPRKQVECLICHKSMRADNLTRHKNSCKVQNLQQNQLETVLTKGVKRKLDEESWYVCDEEKQYVKKSHNLPDVFGTKIDHNELSGDKPLSRKTLVHLMDIFEINKENRELIIQDLLTENSQKRETGEWKIENILLIDRIKRAMARRKSNKDVSQPVGYGLEGLTDDSNNEFGIKIPKSNNETRDNQNKEEEMVQEYSSNSEDSHESKDDSESMEEIL